jgi:NAD(P)-dependent dehydrogenase (short-subunit alcohol dehydrogenase family)
MSGLTGKIAVVTGASRGVGRRIAVRLAREGATVALVARGVAGLNETAAEIDQHGGRSAVFAADLSDSRPTGITALRSSIESKLGAPAILINGAGVFGPISLVKDVDTAAWLETIAINALTPFLLCQAFVGGMIAGGWGRIVNVTSAAALHPPGPTNSAYGTSKVALNQMTRHLASEIAGTGVTANVIHPGDVKTEMWADIRDKVAHMGAEAAGYHDWVAWVEKTGGDDPEKAADLVAGLMTDAAAGVNGQFLWIKDGLQAPIPSWGEPTTTQPWRK